MAAPVSTMPVLLPVPELDLTNAVCTKSRFLTEKMIQDGLRKDIKWFDFVKYKTEHFFDNLAQLDLSRIIIFEGRLKLIIERNTKLNHITLGFLRLIHGSSLLNLNPNLIEFLVLKHFTVDSGETLTTFLSSLKNFKVLEISVLNIDANKIVDTLNKDVINEMKFLKFQNKPAFINLRELLFNQKPLRKIESRMLPKELIESIVSWNNISSIHLEFIPDELLNSLDHFVNLISLRGCIVDFTDEEIKKISKSQKLKELELILKSFNITNEGVNYFSGLRNVEFLKAEVGFDGTSFHDNSLLCFSKCKNLKKLLLAAFQFNEIEDFDLFLNLEVFQIELSNISVLTLQQIVSKSKKLSYCKIKDCENIRKKHIKFIKDKNRENALKVDLIVGKNKFVNDPEYRYESTCMIL